MHQFLHILKFKFIAFIRFESTLTITNVLKNVASSLIYIGFAAGGYFFVQKFIYFLLIDIKVGLFLLHEFISMVLFIFFITVNLGNIIVSYSTLYKSNEVNYLFTKPVLPVKIFAIKFLDNFFYSSSTLIMILFTLLAGYAYYFRLSIGAFLLLILNFIPFIVSAGSIGVIILLSLIRLAESFGVKRVIYTLVASYLLIVAAFFRLTSPKSLVEIVLRYYPYTVIKDNYLGELISPVLKFLPNNWLAQSGYWIIRGDLTKSISFLFLQALFALILFFTAMYLGRRWYFNTWLLNQKIISDLAFTRKKRKPFFSFLNKSILKPQSEAIIKRDLLIFFREPSQVVHFFVLLFLIIIFITSVAGIKYVGLGNFYLQTLIYISILLFNLLFISTLSLRFIFPLISLEGQTIWKLRSAPVLNSSLMKYKLFILSLFILLVGLGLSFFSNFRFGSALTIYSAIVTGLSVASLISINFGMGGLYANYREKNAIRLSSSQGASLSFLLNIVYMLFLVIVLFRPLSSMFLSIMIKKTFSISSIYWTLLPVGIVSAVIIFLFLKIAKNSLQKDL